ncbi:MAG: hypothetical protein R3B81_06245 [bacterium]
MEKEHEASETRAVTAEAERLQRELLELRRATVARHTRRRFWNNISLFVPMALALLGTSMSTTVLLRDGSTGVVDKKVLQTTLLGAIGNGADLRTVRNIYENRAIARRRLTQVFTAGEEQYSADTPLSKVLEDIRSSLFLENAGLDSLVQPVTVMIDEHSQRNPFDALMSGQRDIFENIRIKSGQNYEAIRPEVDKVAAELVDKNSLVERYFGSPPIT